jgi:hypothetical protein
MCDYIYAVFEVWLQGRDTTYSTPCPSTINEAKQFERLPYQGKETNSSLSNALNNFEEKRIR